MVIKNKKIIAIGGGKGGVGKSFLTANLSTLLARQDKKVILVDANMGASNLHTFLGISLPERTLKDFINDKHENLHSILIKNPYSEAFLISGAPDVLGLTAPSYEQKRRLFRGLKALNCDILFLDLPTGNSTEIVDIFTLSYNGMIVLDPMTTTLESSYQFLKHVVYRLTMRIFKGQREIQQFIQESFSPRSKLNLSTIAQLLKTLDTLNKECTKKVRKALDKLSPCFILNNAKDKTEQQVVEPFQKLVKKYLGIHIQFLGSVAYSPEARDSIAGGIPLVIENPACTASQDIRGIAEKLL